MAHGSGTGSGNSPGTGLGSGTGTGTGSGSGSGSHLGRDAAAGEHATLVSVSTFACTVSRKCPSERPFGSEVLG